MRDRQPTGSFHTAQSRDVTCRLGADGFFAVDVETANTCLSSICQIAVVRFERGAVVDIWQSFIDPGEPFAALNVALHGIDEIAVANAPDFPEIIEALSERLSGNVVVTHMPFDRIAIQSALAKHCVASFECSWLDTASVARRAWPRFAKRGYGLKSLAAWCDIDLRHHDAVQDAVAAGLILNKATVDTGISVEEWTANLSNRRVFETRVEFAERDC
jgi:DNA polymerase III subunit epsilon